MSAFNLYPIFAANRMAGQAIAGALRAGAALTAAVNPGPWSPTALAVASAEQIERSLRIYRDPGFNITRANGDPVPELELSSDPWLRLTYFPNPEASERFLVIAPCSGHHPSLLRKTVAKLLETHEVAIAGWTDAAEIPASKGSLDLDAMIDRIVDAVRLVRAHAGAEQLHVLAVCQPAPAALVAATILEEAGEPLTSLALMGGPIDPNAAPTVVSQYALQHPLSWFEANSIEHVPFGAAGAGRRVYPGFMQLASFIAMQPQRHVEAFQNRFLAAWKRDLGETAKSDAFYDDYLAVADLPAEFYLDTLQRVFQNSDLARGRFEHRGSRIDPATLRRTALMTIEGQLDDICAPGQTSAAHRLTPKVELRHQLIAEGVGHYGLFSGSKWKTKIAPELVKFAETAARQARLANGI